MKDFALSEHFGFYELTRTDKKAFVAKNREQGMGFEPELRALAAMLEVVRTGCGHPLVIHSAFRGADLNAAIGGAKTSQHMKGQAADFSGPGDESEAELEVLFQRVLSALIENAFPFGQLIKEEQDRGYQVDRWLHLSLGAPFRAAEKCGQVMTMKNGVYTLLKVVPVGR